MLGFFSVLVMGGIVFRGWISQFVLISGNFQQPYPGANLLADYYKGVAWAIVLGGSIIFWPVSNSDKRALLWIWMVKVIVTLGLMLFFEYQYWLDGDGYWVNGIDSEFSWTGFKLLKSTFNIWHLVWLQNHVVPESFHAAKVTWSMLGMISVYIFYRGFVLYLGRENIKMFFMVSLLPSILFWSSTLGKDPVALFGISLYFFGMMKWLRKGGVFSLILAIAGLVVTVFIRIWLTPICLMPGIILFFSKIRGFFSRIIFILFWLMGIIFSVGVLTDGLRINTDSIKDVTDFRNDYVTPAFVGGGSSHEPIVVNGLSDIIRSAPLALFKALFRPMPWEVPNVSGMMAGIENVLLLGLFVVGLWRMRVADLRDPVVVTILFTVGFWGLFYGFVTSNLGTIFRYKLQIAPMLFFLLVHLARKRREDGAGPVALSVPT